MDSFSDMIDRMLVVIVTELHVHVHVHLQLMDPEADPSQFSSHVSELSLISALNALR